MDISGQGVLDEEEALEVEIELLGAEDDVQLPEAPQESSVQQDVQAREDPETETDEKKLKNAQKPQEVKTERWRVSDLYINRKQKFSGETFTI